ncbi:hypothetical protein DYBT9275_05444 [Dyadobacter sp. CECT 9275]|uniref:Secretion system C-terminal sorting domain-containing protein n=1 Tax=Dyadobacter helix TaxID=2822344 RepID=A0A916JK37_9BACT|nr:T9SS type A sorting domain-containing protein [Dyadobacter sp. CECT 9275]CAG5015930.1 hypothetical protein DYBT9275_05444 [Dyadobacter sp. CECT 9275]
MKKYLYLLLATFTVSTASAIDRTWIGTTSDWATASNWSPSGIPDINDILTIENPTIDPVISDGIVAYAFRVFLKSGATLTIETGASLTVTNAERVTYFNGIEIRESELINNGTITVQMPDAADGGAVGIVFEAGTMTNSGIVNTDGEDGIQFSDASQITNQATGIINTNGTFSGMYQNNGVTNISNSGVINMSATYRTLDLLEGTLSNSGIVKLSTGRGLNLALDATLNNLSCGKIILENTENNNLENTGTIVNEGLIQVSRLVNNSGTITNNGVFKYNELSTTGGGMITNNGIIIDDKTDPIAQVGTSNTFSIEGIYTDEDATTSAGTFTAPDTFSPSDLDPGDVTLYAKIATGDDACTYTVPFVYEMVALPVTLVQFSGKSTGNNQNTLTWLTADEQNFKHFEIQRSSDARSFESIGSVTATSATGSALKAYQFVDSHTAGMNYYRLKMVDLDGSYQFSKIISVLNSVENNVVGSFYPNPSSGKVFVDVYADAAETWQIRVLDTNGKVIGTESRNLQKGMNKLELPPLAEGMNIVQFQNRKSSISRKLIRQ